jgi:hypothetical protein
MMTKKNIFFSTLGIALFSHFAGYCGVYPETCILSSWFDGIVFSVFKPLFIFSGILFLVASGLFFVSDQVFRSWLVFAKFWIPLAGAKNSAMDN